MSEKIRRMKSIITILLTVLCMTLQLEGAMAKSESKTLKENEEFKQQLKKECESLKSMKVPRIGVVTGNTLDGDTLCVDVECTELDSKAKENLLSSEGKTELNSEESIKIRVKNMGETVKIYVHHGIWLKYRYIDDITKTMLAEVMISPEQMSSAYAKLEESGEMKMTLLEQVKKELESMKFPLRINETTTIDTAYVEGNKGVYKYRLTDEKYQYTTGVKESKEVIVKSLKSTLTPDILSRFIAEKMEYLYIYYDYSGDEVYRVLVTAKDLK